MDNTEFQNPVTVSIGLDKYQTTISNGKNTFFADEPEELGGKDTGLTPTEILLSSLGACTAITLKMYADRKQWDLQKIHVHLGSSQTKDGNTLLSTEIDRKISFEGNLDEEQRKRLIQIANSCPVHKILSNPIHISTSEASMD